MFQVRPLSIVPCIRPHTLPNTLFAGIRSPSCFIINNNHPQNLHLIWILMNYCAIHVTHVPTLCTTLISWLVRGIRKQWLQGNRCQNDNTLVICPGPSQSWQSGSLSGWLLGLFPLGIRAAYHNYIWLPLPSTGLGHFWPRGLYNCPWLTVASAV